MARWKLTSKHYLHAEQYGQPTEWERQEMNIDTGRNFRKLYKVPMYIDPEDPGCINKHEGICVVARKGTDKPGDIVFFGPPTMDMEPLDDDARAETEAERPKWIDPINSLPLQIGEEAGRAIMQGLEQQIAAMGMGAVNASLRTVPNADIEALRKMVEAQQAQIAQLLKAGGPAVSEPVVAPAQEIQDPPPEPDEPLPDIDPEAPPAPPPIKVNHLRSGVRR